jgi:hypothetical protein
MRSAPSTLHFSQAFRTLSPTGAIEWEELPSLAGRIRAATAGAAPVGVPWDATRPAGLETAAPSQPFREPLHGLTLREVMEPDVFRHFFGS